MKTVSEQMELARKAQAIINDYTQEQIDLMMSHINSYSRKKLGNKSPYEVFEFQYGRKILDAFHLQKIPADEIILSPDLLK